MDRSDGQVRLPLLLGMALAIQSLPALPGSGPQQGPHTRLELHNPYASVAEGAELFLGVSFTMEQGWHIYWQNPGDSGMAPQFSLEGPLKLERVDWPAPERYEMAGIVNYVYHEKVTLPLRVRSGDRSTKVSRLTVDYLVCKVECIPGEATFLFSLPQDDRTVFREDRSATHDRETIERALRELPRAQPPGGYLVSEMESTAEGLSFNLTITDPAEAVEAFPVTTEYSRASVTQESPAHYTITLKRENPEASRTGGGEKPVALVKGKTLSFYVFPSEESSLVYWQAVALAFIGGILLNFMPCVFPVLALKVLSFLESAANPALARLNGLYYAAGILVSFGFLGGLILTLQATGTAVGWGFQLQSPAFIFFLILLFIFLGFYLLGLAGNLLPPAALLQKLSGPARGNAFLTGVLATVVATPCTAPFMGAALGAALALPAAPAIGIFLSLGAGMALPVPLLLFFPTLLRRLPRPGVWMERFKEFMAFPLFATAIWLLWVLAQQTGPEGIVYALLAALWLAFCVWLVNYQRQRGWMVLIAFLTIALLATLFVLLRQTRPPSSAGREQSLWKPFSQESVNSSLSQDLPVFIDFTASWCLTCQVNKVQVLGTDAAQALFREQNIQLYRADWTRGDTRITQALQFFGRNSVPLYVYYPGSSGGPVILPEILTIPILKHYLSSKGDGADKEQK